MLEHRGSVWRHAPAALGTTLLVAAAVVGTQVAIAQAGNPRAPLSPYGEGGFTVGAAAVDKRVTITSADDGSYVLGYTPAGGDVVLDLDMLSGNSVQPWWYDPRTGRTLKMRTLDSEGVARFPVPKEGGGPSWVLVVDDVAAGYGAPDPDVVAQATGKDESGGATGKDTSTGTTGQAASSIGSTGSSGTGSSEGGDGGTSGSGEKSGSAASGTDPSSTDGSTTEKDSGDSGEKDTSDKGQDGGSTTDGGSEKDGDAQKDGGSTTSDGSEKDDSQKDDSQSDGGSTQDGSGGSGSDASGGDQAGEKDSAEKESGDKDGSGDGGGEPGADPASGSTPEEGRFGDDGAQKDQGDAQKQDGDQKDGDQSDAGKDAGKDQSDAGKKDGTGPVAPEPTKEPEKPAAPAKDTAPAADGSWDKLAKCESSGDWAINTGNGYYGGLQFDSATWSDFGGTKYAPRADKASKEQQIEIASKVRDARGGYSSWPACSSKLGLPK